MKKKITPKIIVILPAILLVFMMLYAALPFSQATAGLQESMTLANTPPTISDIPDQVTDEDQTIGPLLFTIGDLETPAEDLIVTGTSSNQAVVSNSGIFLGGFDETRWVEITPVTHATGTTIITLTVDDGQDTAYDQFQVRVGSENDSPTISPISNQRTRVDTVLGPIPFTIGDVETPVNDLVINAVSTNQTVVSNDDVVLGGTGENRTITLTPQPGVAGLTLITISVSDGELTSYEYFYLLVFTMEIFFPATRNDALVIPPTFELNFPLILNSE
jgi:hypothetical protein